MRDIPMRSASLGNGVLTTEHASSSYGVPVFVAHGRAYGPADLPEPLELVNPTDARRLRTLRHHFDHWRPAIQDRRSLTSAKNAGGSGPSVTRSLRVPKSLADSVDAAKGELSFSDVVRDALEAWLKSGGS